MQAGLVFAATLAFATATAFSQVQPSASTAPLQRSISSSKQFVIYYSDRTVRSRLARMAEDIKTQWLQTLGVTDEWKSPIVIQINSSLTGRAPRLVTNVFESDGGEMKVQLDVNEPTALSGPDFQKEVYRALCLEYAYRQAPPKAGKAFAQPPAWLIEALHQDAITKQQGIPAGLFDVLVQSGPPPKLEAFLKLRPERMDATSRAVYSAQAMGLLRAFLSLPGGGKNLAAYLASLPNVNTADASALLEKFPEFGGKSSELSKVWTLSLANASAADRMKPLNMADTRKQLDLIMDFSVPKDPKKPDTGYVTGPEALQTTARSPSGQFILKQKEADLFHLEVRSHPIMRPIVAEYRTIAAQLAAKPGKNLEKRIRKNMELQGAVATRTGEIEDYLNWFEATQLSTPSKEFDGMMKAPEPIGAPKRTDAISRHLDDLETRGW